MEEYYRVGKTVVPNVLRAETGNERAQRISFEMRLEAHPDLKEMRQRKLSKSDELLSVFIMVELLPFLITEPRPQPQHLRLLALKTLQQEKEGTPISFGEIDTLLSLAWKALVFRLLSIKEKAEKEEIVNGLGSWKEAYRLVLLAINALDRSIPL